MKPYIFSASTKSYFGNGCVGDAIKKEKEKIGKRTLLITGRTLSGSGYVSDIIENLNSVDSEVYTYGGITPNPDVIEIREAISIAKKENVSSVIGFGGGSAIDAAKSVAVGSMTDVDIEDFLVDGLPLPENILPIIAIPTTSGTGAELSKGAIISSRKKRTKSGIRSEKIAPAVAIVDPTYTFSLPRNVTMESGFDVFTHAIESYCSVNANPYSDMFSEKAIKIVGDALPRLAANLDDHEAREMMSFASHIMGYNVKNIGNCLPHRLQYPIGVETETSHGAGLIALYPAWIKYEHTVNDERVDKALDWIGCAKGESAEQRMRKWLDTLSISRTLTNLGNTLSAAELTGMVSGNLRNDKLADIENMIETIYQESM